MKFACFLLLVAFPLGAASWPEPARITGPEFREGKQPRIAISSSRTYHIAFGLGNAIYTTSSADPAASFSKPVKIGELEKLALGLRRGPRIATAGEVVIVTAISHADGQLYSWRSGDAGRTWFEPVTVNDAPKSATEGLHDLASDGHRKLAVVWLDLRNGTTELWGSFSGDAGETWAANTRVYRSPDRTICECCHPSVVFTPAGDIVVMWRNSLNGHRDMYATRSSDGGKSFTRAIKLGTGTWQLQACPMDGGSLAASGNRLAYTWRREGNLFATTEPNSEELLSTSGFHPVVVPTSTGFAYLWQDQGNLYWKPAPEAPRTLLAAGAGFAAAARDPDRTTSAITFEGKDGMFLHIIP